MRQKCPVLLEEMVKIAGLPRNNLGYGWMVRGVGAPSRSGVGTCMNLAILSHRDARNHSPRPTPRRCFQHGSNLSPSHPPTRAPPLSTPRRRPRWRLSR